jgi:HEAT repeat protein
MTVLLGCGDPPPEPAASRYAVTVDLGPTIAQLGAEEQADVDEALERLATIGDPAVPALEDAASHERQGVRLAAVEALAQIDSAAATAALVQIASRNDDPETRATALLHLGTAQRAEGKAALESALRDPAPMVSQTAGVACGALCTSPAAVGRLVDLALDEVSDADLGRMRASLRRLLAGQDQAASVRARNLIRTRTAVILGAAGPIERRVRAAFLAADAGAEDVEAVIIEALRDSTSVTLRAEAAQWLGRSGTAAAVPALRAAVHDRTIAAAGALGLQAMASRGVPGAKEAIAAP